MIITIIKILNNYVWNKFSFLIICFSFKYDSPDQEEGDSQQEIDRQLGYRTKILKGAVSRAFLAFFYFMNRSHLGRLTLRRVNN